MPDLLISVITPAFKAEDTIRRAAASVLGQSWGRLEWIVVSDDGVDYASIVGSKDPRVRQVFTGGAGTGDWNARNVGLAAAAGAFVTLLDADDEYAPNRLEAMVPLVEADGAALDDTAMSLKGAPLATLLRESERARSPPATAPLILRDRVPVFPMWRRSDAGVRCRNLPHASDVILSLELLSAFPTMRVAPNPGYRYLKRPGSMTMSATMLERSRTSYLEILRAIAAGEYAIAPDIADFALYEIAKNLNQAAAFDRMLRADPTLTHELLAQAFNKRAMTEDERVAFFTGEPS